MVRGVGLEPTRLLKTTDFKSVPATNYGTRALTCQLSESNLFVPTSMGRLQTVTIWTENT